MSSSGLTLLLTFPLKKMIGRGPYAKPDYKTKAKIMAKYRDRLNWKEAAKDSGVSFRTVRAWIANPNKDC